MPTTIKFGTDGWRGVIADDFTLDNVRLCTQGVAAYLKTAEQTEGGIVVGYDTRFASEHFAVAAAEVLAGNGIAAHLCRQATPTPAVSYAITQLNAAGAVIITASHNPARYNGYKFRPNYGGAASDEVLAGLQADIDRAVAGEPPVRRLELSEALRTGLVSQFDARPAYLARLRQLVDADRILGSSLRVLADPMYGAGIGYFPALLDGGRVWVKEIHGERNPLFPGMRAPEPTAENLSRLRRTVHVESADVGLATDGDADRLALVDETGRSVENFEVYPLLLYYLLGVLGQRGPVVKTVATSSLVDRVAQRFGAPVHIVGVGFKHVAPAMLETKAILGGEESGGYAFGDHLPERDGILSGLRVVDMLVRTGKPLSRLLADLRAEFGAHFFRRVDLPFDGQLQETARRSIKQARPDRVADVSVTGVRTDDGLRLDLADGSWLLLRLSGTEPIVRVAAEADSEERVGRIIKEGVRLIGLET